MASENRSETNRQNVELFNPTPNICSEEQLKKLNHDLLINGYIRTQIKPKEHFPDIINLCIKFCKVPNAPTSKDSVNFISDKDIKTCDRFKSEGNEYYKQKLFKAAIAKYTTALRYFPNNHFVLNNRATCKYLLQNYQSAKEDSAMCLAIEPSFDKAWYRYGTIYETLKNYKNAGICYKAAYYLSVGWNLKKNDNKSKNKNHYKTNYRKFLAKMKGMNNKDVIEWIKGFETKSKQLNPEDLMSSFLFKNVDPVKIQKMMSEPGGMDKMIMNLAQNKEYLQAQEQQKLYCLFMESKYKALVDGNVKGMSLKNLDDNWAISYGSTPVIESKRVFNVTVCSNNTMKIIGQYTHCGRPKAKDMLRYLYRTMAISNMVHTKEEKPRFVIIDWRSRDMFAEIQNELGPKLGIQCIQETYEDSKRLSDTYKTNVNGWNHLE